MIMGTVRHDCCRNGTPKGRQGPGETTTVFGGSPWIPLNFPSPALSVSWPIGLDGNDVSKVFCVIRGGLALKAGALCELIEP